MVFSVSKRRPLTQKNIREVSSMLSNLQQSVIDLGLGKFPFFKLEDAR